MSNVKGQWFLKLHFSLQFCVPKKHSQHCVMVAAEEDLENLESLRLLPFVHFFVRNQWNLQIELEDLLQLCSLLTVRIVN